MRLCIAHNKREKSQTDSDISRSLNFAATLSCFTYDKLMALISSLTQGFLSNVLSANLFAPFSRLINPSKTIKFAALCLRVLI